MNTKVKIFAAASSVVSAFTLTACGDDVTEVHENSYMAVLESGKKLSKQACDSTNVGEMLFVTDSSATFVCNGNDWTNLKGSDGKDGETKSKIDTLYIEKESGKSSKGLDGKSCSATKVSKGGRSGFELTCGETFVDTIWNGEKGENGSSCTATKVKKDGLNGVEVTCEGSVVGTIWDGADGKNGNSAYEIAKENGFDGTEEEWLDSLKGAGCSVTDDGKGSIKVTCGKGEGESTVDLYMDVCNGVPYDPDTSFCFEGKPYSCNNLPYDPNINFCSEGVLYSCGNMPYDPTVSFCFEGSIYENCNVETYNPAESFCSGGNLYSCNKKTFDPIKQYCLEIGTDEDKVYALNLC